jgi:hypothetical protein
MHPSSYRAFQRDQEHDLKHPGLMDLISTKQIKQTTLSFIDRYLLIIRGLFPKKMTMIFVTNFFFHNQFVRTSNIISFLKSTLSPQAHEDLVPSVSTVCAITAMI